MNLLVVRGGGLEEHQNSEHTCCEQIGVSEFGTTWQ